MAQYAVMNRLIYEQWHFPLLMACDGHPVTESRAFKPISGRAYCGVDASSHAPGRNLLRDLFAARYALRLP
jgi:hypothetical protein